MNLSSEQNLSIEQFPPLPDDSGFAGTFAGVSNGVLLCMGGTNFPGKKPWEGGEKLWYDTIFIFNEGQWDIHQTKLPAEAAYGVSVTYHNEVILIGGNNKTGHLKDVISFRWDAGSIQIETYPELPVALAYMCGALVNDFILITGGNSTPSGPPLHQCLALNLKQIERGWFEIDPWPGSERLLPVCSVHKDCYYLFGGENMVEATNGDMKRKILDDAYCLSTSILREGKAKWRKLSDMPRGISAGPSPLPHVDNLGFIVWGGIDSITALFKDPKHHGGFSNHILAYDPVLDSWSHVRHLKDTPSGVTLPIVSWENKWLYINGETGPGKRTNKIYSIF